jgi:hypothetical protein
MKSIRDILAERKAEIKTLQAQLKREMQDILAAEAAFPPFSEPQVSVALKRGRGSRTTLKDMIVGVLQEHSNGADSYKILELIKEKYNIDVKRESLSPQLSRLKNDDDLLELRGSDWFLLPQKNTAPVVGADNEADDLI